MNYRLISIGIIIMISVYVTIYPCVEGELVSFYEQFLNFLSNNTLGQQWYLCQ